MNAEARMLRHFLDAQRASALAIVDGLDDDQLSTSVVPSGWTPLGLIEHLGFAERHWFQEVVLGYADPLPWPRSDTPESGTPDEDAPDEDAFTTPRRADVVLAFYRAQIERSNQVLQATALDAAPIGAHGTDMEDDITELRWIVLHMIEETARHAGHLDLARELLDGRIGLGPR